MVMSRGPGRLQLERALFAEIQLHGEPTTFEDIRALIRKDFDLADDTKLDPWLERSLRRALQRMVTNGGLIAIGGGGRADPFRYFIHPMIIASATQRKNGKQ
jgi:hypothetical protein